MRIRPNKPPCISCYADGPEIDGYQLFSRGEVHPCAWVHHQCLIDCVTRHAVPTGDGLVLAKACIICGVNVRTEELHSLHATSATEKACAWLHLECAVDYE